MEINKIKYTVKIVLNKYYNLIIFSVIKTFNEKNKFTNII